MHPQDNEIYRFGSAAFADEDDVRRAGMFDKTVESIFVGFIEGRSVYWNGPGGVLVTAGARGGKLRDLLCFSICEGGYGGTAVILDPKGELYAISRKQTQPVKHCIPWNPHRLNGVGSARINPLGHLRRDCPNLVSNMQATFRTFAPAPAWPMARTRRRISTACRWIASEPRNTWWAAIWTAKRAKPRSRPNATRASKAVIRAGTANRQRWRRHMSDEMSTSRPQHGGDVEQKTTAEPKKGPADTLRRGWVKATI